MLLPHRVRGARLGLRVAVAVWSRLVALWVLARLWMPCRWRVRRALVCVWCGSWVHCRTA